MYFSICAIIKFKTTFNKINNIMIMKWFIMLKSHTLFNISFIFDTGCEII